VLNQFLQPFEARVAVDDKGNTPSTPLLTFFREIVRLVNRASGGGSTAISTGAGSVKMASANPAINTVWIPVTYDGKVYYVPGFDTPTP
jgi:hypothetical protein